MASPMTQTFNMRLEATDAASEVITAQARGNGV